MNILEEIWVLVDFRVGNAAQAIALAEAIGLKYEVKYIEYNILANLPNILLSKNCSHVKRYSKKNLITANPPKLVISAGRRTATVAAYLKLKYPEIKLIQIMRPFLNQNIFDLIILPQHDSFKVNSDSKCHVIRTIGTLSDVQSKIEKYQNNIFNKYPSLKSFFGVIIGGNTKDYQFDTNNAKELCNAIENTITYNRIPAFISFSRRTPEHVKSIVKKTFDWPNIIYDPTAETNSKNNPYIGILKHARFLVVTCDSISICSEAASSGKPLYIYCPPHFDSKKHKYLLQQLIDLNIARPFSISTCLAEEYEYIPLNEIVKVTQYIQNNMLS